ncbi:aminotransferase class III-fold pyridoxal phosphate-dependent enzyme [Candidatus Bathyarchaeota archaeon]|nr:aminotransferase class III-fold pyridoxal phosphate-dependent enzyme [Candidatus Bathyarchaeota archaeon]
MGTEELWSLKAPRIVVEPPGPKVREILEAAGLPPSAYRHPLAAEAGGIWIRDPDGNIFLDFISSRCVVNIGHRHPRVMEALRRQMDRVTHGWVEERHKLDRELARITPGRFEKRVYYALTGSAANDCALKLARWATGRPYVIAFAGAFHGMTYGALSLSSYKTWMIRGFGPNLPGVYHMPYPNCYRCPFGLEHPDCDLRCLHYIEDYAFKSYLPPDEVAAVFIEPIAGDAGWIVPPDGYLQGLKELCERYGILLVAEEVQTGFGRTGRWFACEHWGVEPDIIILGKALGGGVPLSAVVARAELHERDGEYFRHGHTFNAFPLGCAAALANIEVIEEEGLIERAERLGAYLMNRLRDMMERHCSIGDVRGKGLLIGVEIVGDKASKRPDVEAADRICAEAFKRGLYIIRMGSYGTGVLRVAPPLVITREQLDEALRILDESVGAVEI